MFSRDIVRNKMNDFLSCIGTVSDKIINSLKYLILLQMSVFIMGCGSNLEEETLVQCADAHTLTVKEKDISDSALVVNDVCGVATEASEVVQTTTIKPPTEKPVWGSSMSVSRAWSWMRWNMSSNE